jgi:hypothetical protein
MGYQGYGYERVDCSKQPKVTKKTAQKFWQIILMDTHYNGDNAPCI